MVSWAATGSFTRKSVEERCVSHVAFDITIPDAERAKILGAAPGFSKIDQSVITKLAERMIEQRFAKGEVVMRQGERGDSLHLIVKGRAEVSVTGSGGPIVLSTAEEGEVVGEIALLSGANRQATVTALSPLLVLTVTAEAFDDILNWNPAARTTLEDAAQELLYAKFLKTATPFSAVDGRKLRELVARLTPRSYQAGEIIVRQGDPGEACYLLRRGIAEVYTGGGHDPEHRLALLERGTIFGEAALLTNEPRNASVRAFETCDVLELRRNDLLELVQSQPALSERIHDLLSRRDRPAHIDGVRVQTAQTLLGTTITTLVDPQRDEYFRLSDAGLYVWERLDGRHAIAQLAEDVAKAHPGTPPDFVAKLVRDLRRAGFLTGSGGRKRFTPFGRR
jgi:CRP-like cAMP-binding protein